MNISTQLGPAPSLSFHDLSCHRGGRPLFHHVNCELRAGRWLYVTGANGVGKTSLLRMVCGLAPVEAGTIAWNGVAIDKQRDAYRADLCYLGHLNALNESLAVRDNLRFTAALAGQELDDARIREVLTQFGVKGRERQLVRHLSQGQKRRVGLARLALSAARLWVLDEPFVAMDDGGIRMLADLVAAHLRGGGLAVLTSHQVVDIGDIAAQRLELGR